MTTKADNKKSKTFEATAFVAPQSPPPEPPDSSKENDTAWSKRLRDILAATLKDAEELAQTIHSERWVSFKDTKLRDLEQSNSDPEELLARMQSARSKAAVRAAFKASPDRLGRAAVKHYRSTVENRNSTAAVERALKSLPAVTPKKALQPGSLNPKYTYESFVVGSCNQFAHAASAAVADAPGKTYNPLYIYGGVGLGKTHLMHACGHAIMQRNNRLQLCYISSEKFMNELINAIRYNRTQEFRERYRSVDVLLIDDVQFMAGKERTQEEFFHTFNSLYDQQKQIVISSDCPPRDIPTLEERLHSRFEWGLIADMEPPDLETKVAILKRKAETMGVTLSDEVALTIASRVKYNIRELEGSLVRVVAFASLRGVPITKTLAQDSLRPIAEGESDVLTIQEIQKAVAASYRLRVDELISKSNERRLFLPRQVAMYLCKTLTNHSYPEIGRAFGGKHHTTVMHSFSKIESLVEQDDEIKRLVSEITETLEK